jgi:glycosyltransferase involved in cell wall biosynthesis
LRLVWPYFRCLYYSFFPHKRPEYFNAAWKNPFLRVGKDRLPELNCQEEQEVFFFLPMVDWHSRMQRSQHLAEALAQMGHVCVYLNPHLGLEYLTPAPFSQEPRLSLLDERIFELHVHLPAERAFDARMPTSGEVRRIVDACCQIVHELGIRKAWQIVSAPAWLEVALQMRERFQFPFVYDCHDYLPGFHRLAHEIVDWESPALAQCDLAMFSSRHLMELHTLLSPDLSPKTVLVRNANRPADFIPRKYRSRADSRRPMAGYIGSLDHWFDVELMEGVIERQPGYDFVFAGRVEDTKVLRLKRYSNVKLLGEIAYREVPLLLSRCDVGIIPFEKVPLTLSTNPVKLYEYFAAALPVVSTALPEVEQFGKLVYIADSPADFSRQLSEAVGEWDHSLREERLITASRENWNRRADVLLDSLQWLRRPTEEAVSNHSPVRK